MNIYEMYGRLAETKERMDDFAHSTLDLLNKIKEGEIDPARLVVTQSGWTLADETPDIFVEATDA